MGVYLARYAGFLRRYPVAVLLLGFLVTGVAGLAAVRLELRSSFEELLPDSYRSVQDLRRLVARVGGLGNLVVAVESDDLKASERFADDLVARLQTNLPPDYVQYIEYKIDQQKAFYERNKYLYAELSDLEEVRDRIAARIEDEKYKQSPLAVTLDFDDEQQPKSPPLDFSDLETKYRQKVSKYDKYTDGYFVGENGRLLAILVKPHGTSAGIDFSRKLVAAVNREIAALNPTSYHPSMKVGLTGKYQTNIDQNQSLIDDIVSTTAFTVILVFLSIYAFYRTMGAFVSLGIAIGMGVTWTFALTYLHIGYLNTQTAFLGSIIVGNGINYGIMFMGRYQEERRRGVLTDQALESSIRNTIQATATASLATCVSFGTLMATEFKGFSQFGFIGGFGMVLCWLATFTVLPSCVVLYERLFLGKRGWGGTKPRRPLIVAGMTWAVAHWAFYLGYGITTALSLAVGLLAWGLERWLAHRSPSGQAPDRLGSLVGPCARLVEAGPRLLLGGFAVLVIGAVVLIVRFIPDSFEYDFSKLLHKSRQKTQAEELKTRVNAIFGESLSPVVILADRVDQVAAIQAEVMRKRRAEPENDHIIDTCKTVFGYLPRDQERKLAVLHEISKLLADPALGALDSVQRQRADRARTEVAGLKLVTVDDLPESMTRGYTELDGQKGRILYVYPMPGAGLWDGRRLIRFAREVRETQLPSGETIYTSGESVIFADMLEAVARDAPRAAVVSVVGVMLLLVVSFRNVQGALTVITSLLAGVLLMGGGMALFDIKLNFFNFVVIPITVGIGVDYAVNVFQRYRLEGTGSVGLVIRSAGGAVALASLTTIIGYCALMIAQNAALTSFGYMANLGEFACLGTALLAMPAYLLWRERQRAARTGAETSRQAAS